MVVIAAGLVWGRTSSTLMIVSTTYGSFENDVTLKLSLKNVTTVTFDAKNALPTMQALLSASSVFVWSDQPFSDGVALANLLADYVDMGGHVVVGMFSQIGGFSRPVRLLGRFNATGMHPILLAGLTSQTRSNMLKAVISHPLLAGVNSFDGGSQSYRPAAGAAIAPYATLVASWSTGEPLIALFDNDKFNGSVVSLGFFPASEDTGFLGKGSFWINTTDGAQIMANAINYRPRRQGNACSVAAPKCGRDHWCVDGVCCNSPCTGPCESCDQPGKLGTCLPTCTSALGCLSDSECDSAPLRCSDIVQGWSANASSCRAYVQPWSLGVCAPYVASCMRTNVAVCDALLTSELVAACGSRGCMRPGACQPGTARLSSDSTSKVCFVLADAAADADSCPGATASCDDSGTCVGDATETTNTSVAPMQTQSSQLSGFGIGVIGVVVGAAAAGVAALVVCILVRRRQRGSAAVTAQGEQLSSIQREEPVGELAGGSVFHSARYAASAPISQTVSTTHYAALTGGELDHL
jgi:hypothetical protein